MFCWTQAITVWKLAWMTSGQLWSRRHHWPWADVIRADFQTVVSHYLHNVNTRLFCTADRMFRTIIIQNSRLIYACFPIKINEVWINRFCVRYDLWRRLQCPQCAGGFSWQNASNAEFWYFQYFILNMLLKEQSSSICLNSFLCWRLYPRYVSKGKYTF